MTAQDLKNSILQLAIQGKLVEQRTDEGTAKELVEQIKVDKEQLIKEKKLKKEKPLPEISEDEIPFEIPESWEWVRLGEIITYQNGYAYNSMDMNPISIGYPVIKSGSIMSLRVVIDSKTDYIEEPTEKMLESKILKGDMLMCLSSQSNNPEPLGKTAIYEFDEPALLNQRVLKMKMIFEDMTKFMYYLINSHYFHYTVSHQGGGSAQANLKLEHVLGMQVPVPPLEEQKRIVTKIEEILPCVEQYDKAYSKLEVFNKKFPEDMQKSILKYAIQGKLVEQRPEEGTAEELYQQIQAEKERLIKEGKIKKEKPLSKITEDEIPFEIPESWKWVRLGSIFSVSTGMTPAKTNPLFHENGDIPWVTSSQTGTSKITEANNYITMYALEKTSLRLYPKHTLLIAMYGQGKTRGQISELMIDATINQACAALESLLNNDYLRQYIFYFQKYNYSSSRITAEGSAQPNLNLDKVKNILVPLPPLEEQKRIVQAIEEVLPYCKQLEK